MRPTVPSQPSYFDPRRARRAGVAALAAVTLATAGAGLAASAADASPTGSDARPGAVAPSEPSVWASAPPDHPGLTDGVGAPDGGTGPLLGLGVGGIVLGLLLLPLGLRRRTATRAGRAPSTALLRGGPTGARAG